MSHARTHAKRCGYGSQNGDGSLNNDFPSVVFHDDKFFKRLIMKPQFALPSPWRGVGGEAVSQFALPSPWRGVGGEAFFFVRYP